MTTVEKKKTLINDYLYRVIGPSHFKEVDEGLQSYRVIYEYIDRECGWRIYKISKTEAAKLPKDRVRYIKTKSGLLFALWDDASMEDFMYGEDNIWKKVS